MPPEQSEGTPYGLKETNGVGESEHWPTMLGTINKSSTTRKGQKHCFGKERMRSQHNSVALAATTMLAAAAVVYSSVEIWSSQSSSGRLAPAPQILEPPPLGERGGEV